MKLKNSDNARYFFSVHGPKWKDVPVNRITKNGLQEWVDELGIQSQSAVT